MALAEALLIIRGSLKFQCTRYIGQGGARIKWFCFLCITWGRARELVFLLNLNRSFFSDFNRALLTPDREPLSICICRLSRLTSHHVCLIDMPAKFLQRTPSGEHASGGPGMLPRADRHLLEQFPAGP